MLTINGGTIQAEPAYRNEYDRAWAEQLGTAKTLTDNIAIELQALSRRPGPARAWIALAQSRRREHVKAALELGKKANQLRAYRKAQKETRRIMAAEAAE